MRFEVYPTVVERGQLRYSGQGFAPDAHVEVYSFTGQLVKRQAASESGTIGVAGLPTGWYLAQLLSAGQHQQARFCVP